MTDWREVLANRNAEPQKPTVDAIKRIHPTWTPDRIRALRLRLGMTQAQLANALGFTGKHRKETINRYEHGAREP